MKTPASLALLLLTSLVPLSACKKLGIPQPIANGGGTNSLHLSASDVAMQAKLQPVIHCINRTFAHYEEILPAYNKRVAELNHRAPAPDSFPDFFEFKIEPYERNGEFATECAAGLDQSISLAPAEPAVDGPAKDAAQALRAILQPGSEMDAYLQQKAYVNDDFAKGRSLDATLSPLLNRLVQDGLQLRAVVRQQEATLREHELDAIDKSEGHSLRWHTPQKPDRGARPQRRDRRPHPLQPTEPRQCQQCHSASADGLQRYRGLPGPASRSRQAESLQQSAHLVQHQQRHLD